MIEQPQREEGGHRGSAFGGSVHSIYTVAKPSHTRKCEPKPNLFGSSSSSCLPEPDSGEAPAKTMTIRAGSIGSPLAIFPLCPLR